MSDHPKDRSGWRAKLRHLRYVTFVIKNLSDVCKELRSKGVVFEVPEKESRPGVRIAMVRDPDGNVVEFVERGK